MSSNTCVTSMQTRLSPLLNPVYRAASWVEEKGDVTTRVKSLYRAMERVSLVPHFALGISTGLASLLSGGRRSNAGKISQKSLQEVEYILPDLYLAVLGAWSPSAANNIKDQSSFARSAVRELLEKADKFADSQNLLVRHGASRAAYLGTAAFSVVARVALGAIGSVAALLSFIPYLPKRAEITQFAYKELQSLGVIKDLFYCATKFMNPWTNIKHRV